MIDLPTPAEIDALIADAVDAADAAEGTPGHAEAVGEALAFAALARAWDGALRPLLEGLASGVFDFDGDGELSPEEVDAVRDAAVGLAAAASGAFSLFALSGFLSAVLGTTETAAAGLGLSVGGPDERVARFLQQHETYWVTRYGERFVEPRIAALLRGNALAAGGDRGAARALLASLGSEYEKGLGYWRLVAVAASHRAGSLGRVAALEATGRDGRLDATVDRRTTQVCRFLDNRRVPLASLVAWRDALLATSTPEATIAADPWWTDDKLAQVQGIVQASGGEAPADRLGLPGFHPHCRTVLVAA